MHELFTKVLSRKDLSRAGDLFSVADAEIVVDLSDVIDEIDSIISQNDYLKNTNDQSVVEICVTRVLSCIRETKTAEKYCASLVKLLENCLQNNLQPTIANKDPPHAKIAADIISSIFLNYNKQSVMELALPIAVKFLQKGNKELSKNLVSYLSLAAIDYANLLSPHVQSILDSIRAGNYGLCRVLCQIYEVAPEKVTPHASLLISLLPKCDLQEKIALLQLFASIAQKKPSAIESLLPQIDDLLSDSSTAHATLQVLLKIAEQAPELILEHFASVSNVTKANPTLVAIVAQILSTAGKVNKDKAQYALDYVLENLPHADRTSQTILLHEATLLCSTYPILFTDKVLSCVRQKNLNASQTTAKSPSSQTPSEVNQTSGGVTIVKLNSTTANNIPKPSQTAATLAPAALRNAPLSTPITVNNTIVTNVIANDVNAVAGPKLSASQTTGVTIHTSNITPSNTNSNINTNSNVALPLNQAQQHTGYTRRAKFGDSRSTGRLHSAGNTHRSMTRLNIAGGSVGGLHKSMTRLSSSQQINQNGLTSAPVNAYNNSSSGNIAQSNGNTHYVTPVPPLSSNVIITGHNKYGLPSTIVNIAGISESGGVTVTTSPRLRPLSQGPNTLLGSTAGASTGSLALQHHHQQQQQQQQQHQQQLQLQQQQQQNSIMVHHASPASPVLPNNTQKSVMTLPVNSNLPVNDHEVSVSGPTTVTSRRHDNTSVTLLNANNSIINQRMSTFEPYQMMRDTVQQFCEKHFSSIKDYMDKLSQRLPPPTRCTIEERRTKKVAKLHFACQIRGPHCLYSKTCFTMRTRNPKTWIHLMFLDFQIRNYVKENCALNTREPGISNLKNMWNMIKTETKSFTELTTSNFPSVKEQETLVNELRHSGFLDVFEVSRTDQTKPNANELEYQWGCFLCNHPEKAVGFLQGTNQPMIEGQLKEKKGKWRLFRRWRTRYFTLSGAHLSCKGSSGGESIDVNQIRSVKVSRGARNIPKAFEIFTADQTLILKPKDGKNAEEWVQCLSIVVAHSQARDTPSAKTNSLPARGMGNSRTAF